MLVVCNAFLGGLGPHISCSVALLSCLMTHPFDTIALVVGQVAPLVHQIACVTGLVSFLIRLDALIGG
jgi:hypothetical protein